MWEFQFVVPIKKDRLQKQTRLSNSVLGAYETNDCKGIVPL